MTCGMVITVLGRLWACTIPSECVRLFCCLPGAFLLPLVFFSIFSLVSNFFFHLCFAVNALMLVLVVFLPTALCRSNFWMYRTLRSARAIASGGRRTSLRPYTSKTEASVSFRFCLPCYLVTLVTAMPNVSTPHSTSFRKANVTGTPVFLHTHTHTHKEYSFLIASHLLFVQSW